MSDSNTCINYACQVLRMNSEPLICLCKCVCVFKLNVSNLNRNLEVVYFKGVLNVFF